MTLDAVKSNSIGDLDNIPPFGPNQGAGAPGRMVEVDDFCGATAGGLTSSGSYYKLVRVPTGAIVKSVVLGADAGPNRNGALALSLNWVFSDSTNDGTPSYQQGLVPLNTNTGGTVALVAASAGSFNNMYGIWAPSAGAGAISPTEFVANGLGANYSLTGGFFNLPLWQIFGFVDARNNTVDPGGYFDLVAFVATGATTGGACNLYAMVRYSI